jgi:hypothetical protein
MKFMIFCKPAMMVLVEDTSQTRGLLTKFCNLVITGLIFSEMLKPMYPIVMNANEWVSLLHETKCHFKPK